MKRDIDIEYKNIDIRYIYITSYYRKTSKLRYSWNIYIYIKIKTIHPYIIK